MSRCASCVASAREVASWAKLIHSCEHIAEVRRGRKILEGWHQRFAAEHPNLKANETPCSVVSREVGPGRRIEIRGRCFGTTMTPVIYRHV